MKTYGGVDIYIYIRFHYPGTSWRRVVSFMLLPLYLRGKSRRYTIDRMLSGHQSLSGRRGEVKIMDLTGIRTPTPRSPVTSRLVVILQFHTLPM
jgi:hypothetical protein